MKKFLFPLCLSLAVVQGQATIHTVVTDGLRFVPEEVIARVGDTLEFDLAPGFSATEVSATTWRLNGNTPAIAEGLTQTFDLEGPGMFVLNTQGQRYYVCKWHHTTGMKGSIKILGPNDVAYQEPDLLMNLYPNPTQNNLYLNMVGANDVTAIIDIMDINGRKVMDLGAKQVLSNGSRPLDVSMLSPGIYYLNITLGSRVKSLRFVKQ